MFLYPIGLPVGVVLLWPPTVPYIPFFLFGWGLISAALLRNRLKSAEPDATSDPEYTVEILESIQGGLIALDREFRFTYVNQAAETLMAKPKVELLGKNVREMYPNLLG